MNNKRTFRTVFDYSTIGLELAIVIFVFTFIGNKLDEGNQTSPVFSIIGIICGMSIGFYNLFKRIKSLDQKSKKEKNDPDHKSKWLNI